MRKERKFNPRRFRSLMTKKLEEQGYTVNRFAITHNFPRNPLARAMIGETRPSAESLNMWCKALECTSQEREEIIASVFDETANDDEEESNRKVA